MKKIVRIALGLYRLTDAQLPLRTQSIISQMSSNANFPGPPTELTAVETSLQEFQQALVRAENGSPDDTALKNAKRVALEQALRNLAGYVEAKSNNDLSVLLTSGFEVRRDPAPVGRLPKPADVKVLVTQQPGTVKISVDRIANARAYLFQYSLAPVTDEKQWKTINSTTRTLVLDNLESGKQYVFRVAGIGTDRAIVFSDEVVRLVA